MDWTIHKMAEEVALWSTLLLNSWTILGSAFFFLINRTGTTWPLIVQAQRAAIRAAVIVLSGTMGAIINHIVLPKFYNWWVTAGLIAMVIYVGGTILVVEANMAKEPSKPKG